MTELEEWITSRPKIIQDMIAKVRPDKIYILKETGQIAEPYSYSENGTMTAYCWQEWMGRDLGHFVFGLDPDDFVLREDKEFDLPMIELISNPNN